ncbi:13257_t:CDS:2, partial [Dentiscutata erythropus]
LSRGDSGIDMFGNHNHYLLLFQCKDLTNKVEVDYIQSVISRFDKQTTIRIYVISAKDDYSSGAMGRTKSSEYHLLLTNMHDLCQDIPKYLSKVLKDNSVREKIYRIEEKIDEIIEILERQEKFIHKIKNDRIKIENKQIKVEKNQIRIESSTDVATPDDTFEDIFKNFGFYSIRSIEDFGRNKVM